MGQAKQTATPDAKAATRAAGAKKAAAGKADADKASADKSLLDLHRATDTLSAMLAKEVKALNARQRQAADGTDANLMKGMKEATAVLKDLAAVAKTLNEQGEEAAARDCGVVLLPPVEDAE